MNYNCISFIVTIILFLTASLRADQICLKDNRIIKGRVLEQTEKVVKYKTDQGIQTVDSSLVDRILYDDQDEKKVLPKPPPAVPDMIVLLDGTVIKGTILRMATKYISYCPGDTKIQLLLPIDFVSKVITKEGITVEFNALKKPEPNEK